MKITPDLFEAYVKCPTKCWLRAINEPSVGGPYPEWVKAQNDSYRVNGTRRLVAEFLNDEVAPSPDMKNFKVAKWRLTSDLAVKAQMDCCTLESELHALERVPAEGRDKPAQFIPIRFVFTNKLDEDDKLVLAFDAFALSRSLGFEIGLGKIIHGDDHVALKVKTSALTNEVQKCLESITILLSNPAPPDLQELLNGYQGVLVSDFYGGYDAIRCRQQECLVHLIRDLNDDLWRNPFNTEVILRLFAFWP
jgi:hypothetical protein